MEKDGLNWRIRDQKVVVMIQRIHFDPSLLYSLQRLNFDNVLSIKAFCLRTESFYQFASMRIRAIVTISLHYLEALVAIHYLFGMIVDKRKCSCMIKEAQRDHFGNTEARLDMRDTCLSFWLLTLCERSLDFIMSMQINTKTRVKM